ncbi:MAG: S41 family peptidase [Butyricimonas faecihominis]
MPERIDMGLLGAKFVKDKSGYFKVTEVIEGQLEASTRSPLTMPGVEVKAGDYILAINGKSLKEVDNLFSELIDMAGKTVELTVNTTPTEKEARNVLVVPLADESKLYYYNWVQNNIRKVNEATNGEVGYIHIPDMGVDGLNEFVKHYYPQLNKKALIIDDRGNGGGNVSPMITERLMRTPTFYTMHTNQTSGSVSPVGTFLGPKVLLVNEYSASDGDLFPYRFKYNHLGTIIGRRTWGGVVGYSGSIRVVDGGSIVTPSYAPFAADGSEFIIEGTGVTPHIDIENDPYLEYNGEDQQLNRAIQVILEKLKTEKKEIPSIPAFPNKAAKKK